MVGLAHSLAGLAKDHLFKVGHKALVVFSTRRPVISQGVTWGYVWVEDGTFDGTTAYASEGQRERCQEGG